MANTITGRILLIGEVENIHYQDKVFSKREVVLDCSRFDTMTGEKMENYPKFEFTGKHVDDLNNYQVGQFVTVSFVLSGRKVEKDGKTSYFTNITAFKIEPYQRYNSSAQQAQPAQAYTPPQTAAQSRQHVASPQPAPFPPNVDEQGNPAKDDLPF